MSGAARSRRRRDRPPGTHPCRGDGRRWRMRLTLQRRIFAWFGLSILLTSCVAWWTVGVFWHAGWHGTPWKPVAILFASGATLWALSGLIARRLARPLAHVADVARDIGAGKLSTRVKLGRHRGGEAGVLGDAINDMAARIEKQMADQRELLAAVSHEIRTPLGHLRILLEMARDRGAEEGLVGEMEHEIEEVDSLVGELLASSRLEFDGVERRPLDPVELAERALARAGLGAELLRAPASPTPIQADPTLLARALANLLDNAKKHGDGVTSLEVEPDDDGVTFVVADGGSGFDEETRERAFEPFYRSRHAGGAASGSLGLGLALVQRIAAAHGGRAWIERGAAGGARVCFRVARSSE